MSKTLEQKVVFEYDKEGLPVYPPYPYFSEFHNRKDKCTEKQYANLLISGN